MAPKKGGKLGPVVEKKIMPVETDPQKLVNYVCGSNINIKGEDIKVSFFGLMREFLKIYLPNFFRSNPTASTLNGFGIFIPANQRLFKSLIPKQNHIGRNLDKWR